MFVGETLQHIVDELLFMKDPDQTARLQTRRGIAAVPFPAAVTSSHIFLCLYAVDLISAELRVP